MHRVDIKQNLKNKKIKVVAILDSDFMVPWQQ